MKLFRGVFQNIPANQERVFILGVLSFMIVIALLIAPFGPPKRLHFASLSSPVENVNTEGYMTTFPEFAEGTQELIKEMMAPPKDAYYVPRILRSSFPENFGTLREISTRKNVFVESLLPHILTMNEEIASDRERLEVIKAQKEAGERIASVDRIWLTGLARKYKLQKVSLDELLKRVDIIPPSLALAQAGVESGWGGSKLMRTKNAPFGMMRSCDKICVYQTLQESVEHYIHNLNTHHAYKKMRDIRHTMRAEGKSVCSLKLIEGMMRYSELGKAYINRVKGVISREALKKYDRARLAPKSHLFASEAA